MTHRDYLPILDGNVARVPLTQDQTALIDAADVDLVNRHHWRARRCRDSRIYYAAATIRRPDGPQATLYMHRLIMNASRGQQVDHKNHDSLDNRRANLRIATHAQNQRNRRGANCTNSSGYLGVSWSKQQRRWHTMAYVDAQRHHLGYYDDPVLAALARDEFMREFGPNDEFVVYNFPNVTGRQLIADTFDASKLAAPAATKSSTPATPRPAARGS